MSCPGCFYETWPTSLVGARDIGSAPGFGAPATRLHFVKDATPAFSVEAIAGVSGAAIPVKIRLPPQTEGEANAAPTRRFLMLKGIPEGVTLSSGFRNRSSWLVAAHEAGDLKLQVPATYQGSFTLEILLYRGEQESPQSQTISVQISPAQAPAAVAAAQSPPGAEAKKPEQQAAPSGVAKEEDAALLHQGEKHLSDGNIVFARVLFEELAARGSAQGAFAMAQTYDPAVLDQLHVVGMQGDQERAKYWYRKAAELGNNPPLDVLSSLKKERPQE